MCQRSILSPSSRCTEFLRRKLIPGEWYANLNDILAVISLLDKAEVLGFLFALSAPGHQSPMLDRCDVWLHGVVTVVLLLVAVIDIVF
jgi:hypothetical protein